MSDLVDKDFAAELVLIMFQSSQDKNYTDFRIRAGARTVACHKVVICAKSDYFKAICKSGMSEAVVDNAILTEGDGEILEAVIKYMYLGTISLTARNVEAMTVAADFIALDRLVQKCEDFMVDKLSVPKLLPYHKLAKKMKLKNLSTSCMNLGKQQFGEVMNGAWFISLSMEEVCIFLQADDLQAANEDDVIHALVTWLENCDAGNELRERYVESLYQCVRFSKCSTSKLKELCKRPSMPKLLKLKILEFLHLELHGDSTEAMRSSTETTPKKAAGTAAAAPSEAIPTPNAESTGAKPKTVDTGAKRVTAGVGETPKAGAPEVIQDQVLLVGGFTTDNNVHENAVFLDKPHKDSILCRNASEFWSSVCVAPGGFIASGGYETTTNSSISSVKMFNLDDKAFCNLPDMLHPRHFHGSVCVENRFFTIGGELKENGTDKGYHVSVNMLDLEDLRWLECDPLPIAVKSPGITAVDNDVLVMGGQRDKGFTTQVCRYDSRTGKRTDCQPMPTQCVPYNLTVTVDRYVFVLNLFSDLFLQYDHKANQWCGIQLPCPLKAVSFGAMTLHDGRLVLTGGEDSSGNATNLVQTYDITNKTWRVQTQTMPLPLERHVAIVVKMPRSK